jgi:transcriptional antiterminator RfaH
MVVASDTGWSVVNTHAHREQLAINNLNRQGFDAYCPVVVKRVRHARKFTVVQRAMFPGYLFVALDLSRDRWRPILSTYGVRRLICRGERPALLDPAFVDALKAREHDGVIAEPEDQLQIGQSVSMAGGYFEGLTAQIIELNANDRVTLLLNLLHGQIKATVPTSDVTIVSA